MTLGVDNRQLQQALRHFNPHHEDVVICLRNSEIAPHIESSNDEVVRNAVHQLFVERLPDLLQFLQNKELINASVASDAKRLVDAAPKGDIVQVAVKVQDLLFEHIKFEQLPLMKTPKFSFEIELTPQLPPYFFRFLHRLTAMAFLHESRFPLSEARFTQIKHHLNDLEALPVPALRCYTLVKQLPAEIWHQLGLVYYNNENRCLELSWQSSFIQLLVNGLTKDPFVLYALQEGSFCNNTVQTKQLAQFAVEKLFQKQRYSQACFIGFKIHDDVSQYSQCKKALDLLTANGRFDDIITLMHQMGDRPFFNQCMEQVLTAFNTLLNPEQFQAWLYRLLSPLGGSPSKPEPLARATMSWIEKNKNDVHLQLVHDFLRGVRSPVTQDVKSIIDHQELKEILPKLASLIVMFGLFILWQQLAVPSATVGAEGSL